MTVKHYNVGQDVVDKALAKAKARERLKRMPVHDHGPFTVRPTMSAHWGVFDSLGREYITQVFDDKINLTQENATFICNALNLYTRAALLDGS